MSHIGVDVHALAAVRILCEILKTCFHLSVTVENKVPELVIPSYNEHRASNTLKIVEKPASK
jgi:hypothetical protein